MNPLQKIQERINTIIALQQEVDSLKPKAADRLMGNQTATAYNKEAVTELQYKITQWGLDTCNILTETLGPTDPNLHYFNKRWNAPLRGLNLKTELTQKLTNASTDLTILIKDAHEKQLAQTTYTTLWELTHPDIEAKTKTMVDQGNCKQALDQAIKTLKGAIARENKHQQHPDSVLALLQATNTANLTKERTMRLLFIVSEVMYRIENE